MNKINLLDCTLRDGGYYNAWDFDPQLISTYIKAMAALPIDVVEIGFRSMPGTGGKFKGGNAYCTDEYIRSLDLPEGRFKIAVMVNGSDLLKYSEGLSAGVDRLFVPSENSPVLFNLRGKVELSSVRSSSHDLTLKFNGGSKSYTYIGFYITYSMRGLLHFIIIHFL